MQLNIFEKKMSNLFVENRLLKFGLVAMVIATISNHMLLQKAINTHKTILVPAQLNTKVEILGDKASDEYIKMFAQVASGLAFTYTPSNVAANFGELLTMFAPDVYPQTKKSLTDLAETITSQRVSNVFYIKDIKVDSARGVFEVHGDQVRWVERTLVDNVPKAYEFGYRIKDGRFLLTALNEIGLKDDKAQKGTTNIEVGEKKSPIVQADKAAAEQQQNGGKK